MPYNAIMQTARVTDLAIGESLTIVSKSGNQRIVWIKKPDASSIFKFRRMHFIANKLSTVMDIRKLGSAEDDELKFRLASGWKRV